MHVLICNDDGVAAPGIRALAEGFQGAGYRVSVCAPDRERSCASHSLTMQEPLYVRKCEDWQGIDAYAVSGTPADCCKLGLECLARDTVDLVVSGINQGANTGSDTLYSGTVAAAMEAALSGVRAMAVSLTNHRYRDFSAATRYALWVARALLAGEIPACAVYNLNVPPLPFAQIKGLRASKLARMRYTGGYEQRTSPFGRTYYWLRSQLDEQCLTADTDAALTMQGWAALTPLDWTLGDADALNALSRALNQSGRENHGTV